MTNFPELAARYVEKVSLTNLKGDQLKGQPQEDDEEMLMKRFQSEHFPGTFTGLERVQTCMIHSRQVCHRMHTKKT
jgi:hypothetical protein